MNDALSIFFLSIISLTNLMHGVVVGIVSALLGLFGKSYEEIRWAALYALTGILFSCIFVRYTGSYTSMNYTQLNLFVPLFAAIGLVWSGIFKYRVKDVDWGILALFPVVGVIAAVVYQVRGAITLFAFAALGMTAGGIIWYLAGSRLRSAIAFGGIGIILQLVLLPTGYSSIYIKVILSGLFGGVFGWFTWSQTLKWIVALGTLGALVGSIIHYFIAYSDGLLPILIGGIVGGIGSIFIHSHRQHKMFTFILLGGVFFCTVKFGWDWIQFLGQVSFD